MHHSPDPQPARAGARRAQSVPEAQRADWVFTIALLLLALAPRLYVALAWSHEPVWDAHYYHYGATRIAEGFGYTEDVVKNGVLVTRPWAHYPVGYSAALGLVYRIFGAGTHVGPLMGAAVGAILAAVTHRVGLHGMGVARARIAGALVAFHPGLIAYAAVMMSEPLGALLILLALWAALALRSPWTAAASFGFLLGVGALVRPLTLGLIPLWLLMRWTGWRTALGTTACALAVAFVPILPWTARNCSVMDGCTLISTNGGWNLAIGTITKTGRFEALHASDGCPVVRGQVDQDRCWGKVALGNMQRDPLGWAALIPLKLSQTFDHESFAIEYLHEAAPEAWPEERRRRGRDLLTYYHWAIAGLAALAPLALVTQWRRRAASLTQSALILAVVALVSYCWALPEHPFFAVVIAAPFIALVPFPGRPWLGPVGRVSLGLVLVTAASHAVFFGEDRYHLVLSPFFCLLAARALTREASGGSPGPLERAELPVSAELP